MLGNPTYMGMVCRKWRRSKVDGLRLLDPDEQIWSQGQHEPIVPRELFETVQMARRTRHRDGQGNVRTGRYLLGGLLRCGKCGRRMQGHSLRLTAWSSEHLNSYTYRCDINGHGSCGLRWVDRWVLDCVAALPITEEAIAAVHTLLANRDGNTPGRIEALQAERADLERKLSTLGDMLLAGPNPIVRRMFDAKSTEIAGRLASIEQELTTLLAPTRTASAALAPIEAWLRGAGTVKAVLEAGTRAQQAELVASTIDHIVFKRKEDPIIVWQPWAAALLEATGAMLPRPDRRGGRPRLRLKLSED
jgi:hypothetical protein